jgi:hypothetical protein
MATLKAIPAATAAESPEELALAQATDQVRRAKAARQETVDALTTIRALTQQTTEHTAASRVMEIQNLPGTRVGVFRTVDGTPPTPVANVSRADLARARLAQASAEEAAIVADADLLDAERALTDARRAVARRLLRDALPALTADMDRLLAEVDTVAAKAAAFTAERICPCWRPRHWPKRFANVNSTNSRSLLSGRAPAGAARGAVRAVSRTITEWRCRPWARSLSMFSPEASWLPPKRISNFCSLPRGPRHCQSSIGRAQRKS